MAKAKSTTKVGNTTVKGANAADKQEIAAAKAKTEVTKRGDQAPEAKATPKAKTEAADKLFTDADTAARLGIHPDMTIEQHENMVRRAATGF